MDPTAFLKELKAYVCIEKKGFHLYDIHSKNIVSEVTSTAIYNLHVPLLSGAVDKAHMIVVRHTSETGTIDHKNFQVIRLHGVDDGPNLRNFKSSVCLAPTIARTVICSSDIVVDYVNYHSIHVWRIPMELSPPVNFVVSSTNSFSTPIKSTERKILLHTPQSSGSKSEKLPTFSEANFSFQFVPSQINVFFLVGANSSGKSLIIRKWKVLMDKTILEIRPAKTIGKNETFTKNGDSHHKPIQLPDEDLTDLKIVWETLDLWPVVQELFLKVCGGKWSLDTGLLAKVKTVYFVRCEPDHTKTYFLLSMVSDGLRQVLRIILRLKALYIRGITQIIILDEPESHLHPALYLNLINCVILPMLSADKDLKLVVATHNFHVVETISAISTVYPIIIEIKSHRPCNIAPVLKDYYSATQAGTTMDDEPLFSCVTVSCVQADVFLVSPDSARNRPCFSSGLIQDMTGQRAVVVYCEGKNEGSIDIDFYKFIFDESQVEVRVASFHHEAGGSTGCAEVEAKVAAARKAKNILRLQTPMKYFGIRDRDRQIFSNWSKELIVLPLAELENVFWHSSFLALIPELMSLFEGRTLVEAQDMHSENFVKFGDSASKLLKKAFVRHCQHYATEAINFIIREAKSDFENDPSAYLEAIKVNTADCLEMVKNAKAFETVPIDTASLNLHRDSDYMPVTVFELCQCLFVLQNKCNLDNVRMYGHLVNEKPIAQLCCGFMFTGKFYNVQQLNYLGVCGGDMDKFKKLSSLEKVLQMCKCVIFCEMNIEGVLTLRTKLLDVFQSIFRRSRFPDGKHHPECTLDFFENMFRR